MGELSECRNGGTRPASPSSRKARYSSRSTTTAWSSGRSQRKVTTQSSHVVVPFRVQVSQSMTRCESGVSQAIGTMLAVPCDRPPPTYAQRSLDDLGIPLSEVTFCVVDLETTGISARECAITEVGAARFRGGECLGTFQTMVDPGCGIPPLITVLTGITESMVAGAPRIRDVLPSLEEFVGEAVLVGHNVRFDLSFLREAARLAGRASLANRSVDTCALARRLLSDEVPNCRLGTLARHLRLGHQPCHRALDDVLATADLLHLLIERAGTLGVSGLDDLLGLPSMAGHPQAGKLALTEDLPRSPGVYLFRDRNDHVLYVGKATNLRARVRSYFSSDRRRKTSRILAEMVRIDHVTCTSPLEAAVIEIRLIHEHLPRFNRHGTNWSRYAYIKLSLGERFPRLSAVRVVANDGGLYLGPVPSVGFARRAIEAVESVVPLRRCTLRPESTSKAHPCAPAQLGVATCPCSGQVTETAYAALVEHVAQGLTNQPGLLLQPLEKRMHRLATQERFEEAATVRERARILAGCLLRQRRFDLLRRSGSVRVRTRNYGGADLVDGRLERAWAELPVDDPPSRRGQGPDAPDDCPPGPVPKEDADELNCVAVWFDRQAHRLSLLHCDGTLIEPIVPLPDFEPKRDGTTD